MRWYADPLRAADIADMRRADYKVSGGENALRTGIAAVTARLENGTLRVVRGACPNLLGEAELYRYADEPEDRRSETPLDDRNHVLAALRYLVSKLSGARAAGRAGVVAPTAGETLGLKSQKTAQQRYLSIWNEDLWRPVW